MMEQVEKRVHFQPITMVKNVEFFDKNFNQKIICKNFAFFVMAFELGGRIHGCSLISTH